MPSTNRADVTEPVNPVIDEIAAAGERRRAGLFEHHLADSEERRHHRDAQPEADAQHSRPYRMRNE